MNCRCVEALDHALDTYNTSSQDVMDSTTVYADWKSDHCEVSSNEDTILSGKDASRVASLYTHSSMCDLPSSQTLSSASHCTSVPSRVSAWNRNCERCRKDEYSQSNRSSGSIRCCRDRVMSNLGIISERILDDKRIHLNQVCLKEHIGFQDVIGYTLNPQCDKSIQYASEVLRCVRNDIILEEMASLIGCDLSKFTSMDYRSWCNCPCELKVYDHNHLDKMVVESCLRTHVLNTFGSMTEAQSYLESTIRDIGDPVYLSYM